MSRNSVPGEAGLLVGRGGQDHLVRHPPPGVLRDPLQSSSRVHHPPFMRVLIGLFADERPRGVCECGRGLGGLREDVLERRLLGEDRAAREREQQKHGEQLRQATGVQRGASFVPPLAGKRPDDTPGGRPGQRPAVGRLERQARTGSAQRTTVTF